MFYCFYNYYAFSMSKHLRFVYFASLSFPLFIFPSCHLIENSHVISGIYWLSFLFWASLLVFIISIPFPGYFQFPWIHKQKWATQCCSTPHLVGWVCSDFQHQFVKAPWKFSNTFWLGTSRIPCLKSRRLWS